MARKFYENICRICLVSLNDTNQYKYTVKKHNICIPCDRRRTRVADAKLKLETMLAYGGKCACCGEPSIEFLTIDHINENGAEHRRQIFNNVKFCGGKFYRWLKKQGYPKDNFQVLCFNCNSAKHYYGICPHKNPRTQ